VGDRISVLAACGTCGAWAGGEDAFVGV
jgi:hypothetical protein